MIILNRFEYETREAENKLSGIYQAQHRAVVEQHMNSSLFSLSRHVRRMSATIWNREQARGALRPDGEAANPKNIQEEILSETRAILSDYGILSLSGLRLLISIMAIWLLLQAFVDIRLNFVEIFAITLICTVVYPIMEYRFWNSGAVHPFKDMKLILGILGALVLGCGTFLLGRLNSLNLLLQGDIQVPFNLTEFLILFNVAVILSFVIHYRRMNQFTEVYNEYEARLVSLSSLNAGRQEKISRLLDALDPIPLKTHTKRNLKRLLIEAFQESEEVSETWVRDFIRENCIDMNWIYWSGTVIQGTLLILLASKLVWTVDSGLMVSADYFRQGLTTGMALGAMLISGVVICPLNHGFRKLLYQGESFSLKHAWMLMCMAVLCVSLTLLTGLVPSRFIWGSPVNPAPTPWGFTLLLTLIAILQFLKNESRFAGRWGNEK